MRPTKEELEDLYVVQKVSPETIAKTYGVHGHTVRDWMEKYGIPRLGPSHLRAGKCATWNVGREFTPEQRENNSKAHLGKRPHNYGQGRLTFPCEVCGQPVFDKPYRRKHTCSEACRNQLMHIRRGEQHWNYKGEQIISPQRYRNWSRYKEWRIQVLERANHTCARCGKRDGHMIAHHLYALNSHPEYRFDPENGACICRGCHSSFHRTYNHRDATPDMFREWLTKN